MKNNDFTEPEILDNSEFNIEQPISNSLNNPNLTNDQKLEYLITLIQNVEENIETNGLSKKLSK